MTNTLTSSHYSVQHSNCDAGISLIEVLVSIVLLGLMASAGLSNLVFALRTAKTTEANYAATSLANEKIEEISAIDVGDIDASLSGTENSVEWSGLETTFTRVTTVTVKTDGTRTVDVLVTSNNPNLPVSVNFDTEYALWE